MELSICFLSADELTSLPAPTPVTDFLISPSFLQLYYGLVKCYHPTIKQLFLHYFLSKTWFFFNYFFLGSEKPNDK